MNDPISDWMRVLLAVKQTTEETKVLLEAHLREHRATRHNGSKEIAVLIGGSSTATGGAILGVLKLLGVL